MRKLKTIILHHSQSDVKAHDDIEVIRDWHIQRGFNDIGYHYVITKDGISHIGRPIDQAGAHAKGYNSESVGICLTGDEEFSEEQFKGLADLIKGLFIVFGVMIIKGHNEVSDKICPNFDVQNFIETYL